MQAKMKGFLYYDLIIAITISMITVPALTMAVSSIMSISYNNNNKYQMTLTAVSVMESLLSKNYQTIETILQSCSDITTSCITAQHPDVNNQTYYLSEAYFNYLDLNNLQETTTNTGNIKIRVMIPDTEIELINVVSNDD